jgi:hypothetical protein
VCHENQSIDDSDAPLARDLRLIVRERLRRGDSDGAVVAHEAAQARRDVAGTRLQGGILHHLVGLHRGGGDGWAAGCRSPTGASASASRPCGRGRRPRPR